MAVRCIPVADTVLAADTQSIVDKRLTVDGQRVVDTGRLAANNCNVGPWAADSKLVVDNKWADGSSHKKRLDGIRSSIEYLPIAR